MLGRSLRDLTLFGSVPHRVSSYADSVVLPRFGLIFLNIIKEH